MYWLTWVQIDYKLSRCWWGVHYYHKHNIQYCYCTQHNLDHWPLKQNFTVSIISTIFLVSCSGTFSICQVGLCWNNKQWNSLQSTSYKMNILLKAFFPSISMLKSILYPTVFMYGGVCLRCFLLKRGRVYIYQSQRAVHPFSSMYPFQGRFHLKEVPNIARKFPCWREVKECLPI